MVSTKAIHAFASSWRCRCPSATLVCRLLIASSTFAFSLGFAAHRMRLMTALARCLSDQVALSNLCWWMPCITQRWSLQTMKWRMSRKLARTSQ
eukprot:g27886.t1